MDEKQTQSGSPAAVAQPAAPAQPPAPEQLPAPGKKAKPPLKLKGHSRARRWIKRIAALAVLAAVIVFLLSRCMSGGQGAAASGYIPAKAGYQDLTVAVSGSGTIEPIDAYQATALVRGEILEAPFEVGDTVQEGDVLFRIDASSVESSIQQQENALQQQQIALQQQENTLHQQEIALQQAQLNYDELLKNQADAREDLQVEANAAGVINHLYVDQGDTVTAGSPIADILDREHMELELPFHTAGLAGIAVGQPAAVTVDGTGETIPGTVAAIAPTDSVGAGGTLVRNITIRVNNPGALTDASTGTAVVGGTACAAGGTFAYAQSAQVTAMTGGKLASLTVKEGDWVSDGQVIGAFEETDMSSQIEAARLSVESARSNVETARNSVETARINIDTAQQTLQDARDSLDDYVITSPITGTVIEMNYSAGDNIDPTAASAAAGPMAVIYDMSGLEFEMEIDELDISQIQAGQQVAITAEALDGQAFAGVVDRVNINGVTANGATTYPVTVLVDDPQALLPGMNVSARIIVEELPHTLCVPVEAVSRDNTVLVAGPGALSEDGRTVADATKIRTVPVTLGRNGEEYIEITSGLSEGDIVLIESQGSSLMDLMTSAAEGGGAAEGE